ncbi:four helix bundle protein [Flagellimonas meishanensis]|uniref:four helix bundle protein n=1 Tax=Flagellimonas meishanensis TaxID=2873264 RepID=UPI001CA61ED1|nr:four helix bundle protein [[Muricauda] meishanensis]
MEKGFEQLVSWQKARKLNIEIYRISGLAEFSRDFGLRDQIRRASISISSNIAEGFGRKSNKQFIYFLNVALASCYEVKSQLYLAMDIEYVEKDEFEKTYRLCDEISKTIYGLIKHLELKVKTDI